MRHWVDFWRPFIEVHGAWWAHVARPTVTYTVPPAVIQALSTDRRGADRAAHRGGEPLIDATECAAETAFHAACKGFEPSCVGVRSIWPVVYPLPDLPTADWEMTVEQLNAVGATPVTAAGQQILATAKHCVDRVNNLERQHLGYAGKLLFAPKYAQFRVALRELQHECGALVTLFAHEPVSESDCQYLPLEDILVCVTL